jgi:hypothetical protein
VESLGKPFKNAGDDRSGDAAALPPEIVPADQMQTQDGAGGSHTPIKGTPIIVDDEPNGGTMTVKIPKRFRGKRVRIAVPFHVDDGRARVVLSKDGQVTDEVGAWQDGANEYIGFATLIVDIPKDASTYQAVLQVDKGSKIEVGGMEIDQVLRSGKSTDAKK